MTRLLFRDDAYLKQADATVLSASAEGVVLDQSLFYARGGGQPGDTGHLEGPDGPLKIIDTVKGQGDTVQLLLEEGAELPKPGAVVTQMLDWERRYTFMRVHTALHLLSVVIPLGVTGGSISDGKGRLDFDMPEPPEDKARIEAELNALIARDLPVTEDWITDAELDANPVMVKTMSVNPPRGSGQIRLIRIGEGPDQIDLQPCGGTHVRRTGEIGSVRLGKVEKKGAQNRRVYIHLT